MVSRPSGMNREKVSTWLSMVASCGVTMAPTVFTEACAASGGADFHAGKALAQRQQLHRFTDGGNRFLRFEEMTQDALGVQIALQLLYRARTAGKDQAVESEPIASARCVSTGK